MNPHPTISERIADLSVGLVYDDLPAEAKRKAANLVLDVLGSIIGSRSIESSRIAAEVALELGGPRESTVVGHGAKVAASNAAFANAIQGYAFDFADDHNQSNSHLSVATVPVSLALGEKLRASGKELVEAVALGDEIVCRLGSAFLGKTYYQGFHPTSTCGTFGAALSAAKLLRLDRQETVHSLGIAGSQVGGLMAWNTSGSYTKRLQAGHPAMVGIISAMMAQRGFDGPPEIFEGEDGFLQAYSYQRQYNAKWITEGLGDEWEFVKTSIKVYPCCRYSAGHLDACLDIARRYRPDPEDIAEVLIRSSEYTIKLLARPRKMDPQNVVDTQFSMPWQAAIALIDGVVNTDTFKWENIHRSDVRELMTKVDWVVDAEFERRYPEHYSCAVTVRMTDGTEFTSEVENPKGDWRNPVTQDELERKFISLAAREIDDVARIARIVDIVTGIHEQEDVSDLFNLLG